MLMTFPLQHWDEPIAAEMKEEALQGLENGHILFFPKLSFDLLPTEQLFLNPQYAHPRAKNISYITAKDQLHGFIQLNQQEQLALKKLMHRFSQQTLQFAKTLLPLYATHLQLARTSLRPVQISNRNISPRKDDKRLHVDAFPSKPNQGKRIFRVFCNIHPTEDRVWRIGEPFEAAAKRFIPQIRQPLPGSANLLKLLKITKSYRTKYDHYMLRMHDRMKADEHYQRHAPQQEIRFPPHSTWIVQTDDVLHAAMSGQHLLEQTFDLPIHAMRQPMRSPLRVLENLLERSLA